MHRLVLTGMVLAVAAPAFAADVVPVPGTAAKYPRTVVMPVAGKPTQLDLTGVGLRSRFVFDIYAIGSYVQTGTAVSSAADLVKSNAAKVLYLVMERDVSGKDFTDAIRTAMAKSMPGQDFAGEFAQLSAAVGEQPAKKGEHVILTASPAGDLTVSIVNRVETTIKNPAFTRGVWEIYLGDKPVDGDIRTGLTSLLGK